ncbi:MAG: glycogen-binding domain-containing protein [Treponema sp.]|nr:glycogen-binding domain-containing protein [Treponema sp.]
MFFALAAVSFASSDEEKWNYSILVSQIDSVQEPYLSGNSVIFTAREDARHVGIALDYENFSQIHSFSKKVMKDEFNNVTSSFYFYVLELPKNVQEFKYRLVIDGLWTMDPLNSNSVFDPDSNLMLSVFDAGREIPEITEEKASGTVRFVYKGESGRHIRLGGSFTNWDSWIYELKEVSPGLYQLDLALPPGTYQYCYYSGIKSFVDKTNPERCYSNEGKEASLLVVK